MAACVSQGEAFRGPLGCTRVSPKPFPCLPDRLWLRQLTPDRHRGSGSEENAGARVRPRLRSRTARLVRAVHSYKRPCAHTDSRGALARVSRSRARDKAACRRVTEEVVPGGRATEAGPEKASSNVWTWWMTSGASPGPPGALGNDPELSGWAGTGHPHPCWARPAPAGMAVRGGGAQRGQDHPWRSPARQHRVLRPQGLFEGSLRSWLRLGGQDTGIIFGAGFFFFFFRNEINHSYYTKLVGKETAKGI